jgi:hypothetical protein
MPKLRLHAAPRAGLLLLLAAGFSGCFRYVPADVSAAPQGTPARIVMTRMGAEQLREVMPEARDGAPVRGTVVGSEGRDLLLNVPVARRQEGVTTRSIEQRIRIPMGEIVSFERRELNGTATALTIAAGAAAVAGLVFGITEARKGDNPDPPGPPDEAVIEIPILSILFGR